MPSNKLATVKDVKEVAVRRESNIIKRAGRISSVALRAPELPRFEPTEEDKDGLIRLKEWGTANGWEERDLMIAHDALCSSRNAPFYLTHAANVMDTASKLATAGRSPATVAVQVVLNQNERKYEVIDVTSTEK